MMMKPEGSPLLKLSDEEIDACRTPKGGWTRAQLAKWNVPWPPPKGWRQALLAGEPIPGGTEGPNRVLDVPSLIRPEVSAHDLLRKVVVAVINAGHASDLYAFPDVLEYFGAKRP